MPMKTIEIPRERWHDFLELINHQAVSRWVRIEVESGALGHQELNKPWPLLGMSFERKGSGHGSVELSVGREREEFTHVIHAPEHLYVLQDDAGDVQTLAVADAEGGRTLVHFELQPAPHAQPGSR